MDLLNFKFCFLVQDRDYPFLCLCSTGFVQSPSKFGYDLDFNPQSFSIGQTNSTIFDLNMIKNSLKRISEIQSKF